MANVRTILINSDTVTDFQDVLIVAVDDLIFRVGDDVRFKNGSDVPKLLMSVFATPYIGPWPGVSADLGTATDGWANAYIGATDGVRLTAGAGTPEGAVTAPVGSLFMRTDGGAATTLYVKESGAGNTGWIGK